MKIDNIQTQQVLLQEMAQMSRAADGIEKNPIGEATGVPFSSLMNNGINAVDLDQHKASALMQAVETGQSDDLVGAMVASQKAGLSFSALLQVRNKLVSGFDDIMRIPL
ncbi:flagellar hook-basal body complex protein FliE [Gallaecimonas mangrovi]|uniref:flagellar hook-basal body complex protein FliE n=1 Tax=Gallaecimonas mangrovi TaxID=2291597 RepID=UPI000E208E8B|nr:flagellar hook-basal body complex protein FliE [Gallaecimonas mangrovi]